MITKIELDKLVEKYETVDFIKDDPIQFAHRGKCKGEIELYGFIASLFAYGNRKLFIKKLDEIFGVRCLAGSTHSDVAHADNGQVEAAFFIVAPIKKFIAQPYACSV